MTKQRNKMLEATAEVIKQLDLDISFTLLEVGARQLSQNEKEPFYELLDYYPSSKVIGFEIEDDICNQRNLESTRH